MIAVIDYEMGNLGSVAKALAYIGQPPAVTDDPEVICRARPCNTAGVGAMSYARQMLADKGLDEAIQRFLATGRAVFRICLGMQLMFESSEEGDAQGLGILPGTVRRFQAQPGLKIPHMGWNQLEDSRLPELLPEGCHFYFVHSYYCDPAEQGSGGRMVRPWKPFCRGCPEGQPAADTVSPGKKRQQRSPAADSLDSNRRHNLMTADSFIIYPAIDLLDGRCVRLRFRATITRSPSTMKTRWRSPDIP
jgi:glutamine amidotransferase